MNTKKNSDNTPLRGDERLDDALLREHARAGTGADEQFLARMAAALDADAATEAEAPVPEAPKSSRHLIWKLGLAASIVLSVVLIWMTRPNQEEPIVKTTGLEPVMHVLTTEIPPELIEGTPKPIRLPETTPSRQAPSSSLIAKRTKPSDQGKQSRPRGEGLPKGVTPMSNRELVDGVMPTPTARPQPLSIPLVSNETSFTTGLVSGVRDHRGLGNRRDERAYRPPVNSLPDPGAPIPCENQERYGQLIDNPWQTPLQAPLSTFSIDVDTASYSNLRRMAQSGVQIPPDAVRLEEMVNYFDYSYAPPSGEHPFAVHVGNAACPWNPDHQLVRVALKGREIERTERAPANLVFLLDVSGSMNSPDKLPLVIDSFQLLIEEMNASDTLSIVVYAGAEGLALPPTRCDAAGRERVASSLRNLRAGGSTNGGAGIKLAYQLAREQFKPGGINRVILATDGDFNVGVTGNGGLVRLVEQNAKSKVFLTVLGFGTGNLNDSMMEAITNKGNGTYHYIDSQREARRVFLRKLMGTLVTIAKDVKIQVEFNPSQVRRYRLLGYANRMLRKEDFNNDRIDAGDIGSGHTVTAFYEVETGDASQVQPVNKLRYQQPDPGEADRPAVNTPGNPEWLQVNLRYKQPDGDRSTLMEHPFIGVHRGLNETDADFRFGTAVAMTGLLLRNSEGMEASSFADAARIASQAVGADPHGQRTEFLQLVERLGARGR